MAIQVATAADLNNVRNNLAGEYLQTRDIDLEDWGPWNPIGQASPFIGTYDGGNHRILNMTCSKNDRNHPTGLFGWGGGAVKIRNTHIRNAYCYNGDGPAPLFISWLTDGTSDGYIQMCTATGESNANRSTGLFVALVNRCVGFKFEKCAARGKITQNRANIRTSGFSGETMIGNTVTFKNCFARAEIIIIPPDIGGHGSNQRGGFTAGGTWVCGSGHTYKNCYAACTIQCENLETTRAYGFVPTHKTNSDYQPTVINCYYDATLWPHSGDGTFVANAGTPRPTPDMTHPENFGNTYSGWDFVNVWKHDPTYQINAGYPHFDPPFAPFRVWVKKSGEWQPVTAIWARKGGAWQPVSSVDVNKDGWKPI